MDITPRAIVAIVGRPNVGKSTLFNRLTGSRDAIVDDRPGVTIDRNYGQADLEGAPVWLVDTGGFEPTPSSDLFARMKAQASLAMEEADVIVCVLDGRSGLMPDDRTVADLLRRSTKPVVWVVNKIDGIEHNETMMADFHGLGVDPLYPISAAHKHGIAALKEAVADLLPPQAREPLPAATQDTLVCRVAVMGRPNAGKSTLVNRLLRQDRMVVSDVPGTTRDAVETPFESGGNSFVLVDTAGMRKKAKIDDFLERLTVMRSILAMERCHVCILLMDAEVGPSDQDLKLAALACDRGKALILAMNKWDLLSGDQKRQTDMKEYLARRFVFLPEAEFSYICATTGKGTQPLLDKAHKLFTTAGAIINTSRLNTWLSAMTDKLQPPVIRQKRVKLYFISQVDVHPPTFVIKTNTSMAMPDSYVRYLTKGLSQTFELKGVPLRLVFRKKESNRQTTE